MKIGEDPFLLSIILRLFSPAAAANVVAVGAVVVVTELVLRKNTFFASKLIRFGLLLRQRNLLQRDPIGRYLIIFWATLKLFGEYFWGKVAQI